MGNGAERSQNHLAGLSRTWQFGIYEQRENRYTEDNDILK